MLFLCTGPARQTRQNFGRSGNFFIVPDRMSDIKLPVKHTFLYKVCQKFCQSDKIARLPDLLSGKCRHRPYKVCSSDDPGSLWQVQLGPIMLLDRKILKQQILYKLLKYASIGQGYKTLECLRSHDQDGHPCPYMVKKTLTFSFPEPNLWWYDLWVF